MGNQLYESGPLDTNVFTEMPAGEWTLPDNVTPFPLKRSPRAWDPPP